MNVKTNLQNSRLVRCLLLVAFICPLYRTYQAYIIFWNKRARCLSIASLAHAQKSDVFDRMQDDIWVPFSLILFLLGSKRNECPSGSENELIKVIRTSKCHGEEFQCKNTHME